MRTSFILSSILGILALNAPAADWYVATNGNDMANGATWATAKATIQAAIDAANSNDTVWVSNGMYAAGGRVVHGAIVNRVAIDKPITVQSLSGAQNTIIRGERDPSAYNGVGDLAVRCAYVGTNGMLSGFTLIDGATRGYFTYIPQWDISDPIDRNGGGVWGETSGVINACVIIGNSADDAGGGGYRGQYVDCMFSNNLAVSGGGVYEGILRQCSMLDNEAEQGGATWGGELADCIIENNLARANGGGAWNGVLRDSRIQGNRARSNGGGIYRGTAERCVINGNSACFGGGVCDAALIRCAVMDNRAASSGGGVIGSTLDACAVAGNFASLGGGVNDSDLVHCTVVGNSANNGGGAYGGKIRDSIVFNNKANAGSNHLYGSISGTCTAPLPSGTGNISEMPQLASLSRLASNSPCIGAGTITVSEIDFDGDLWMNPPSMGCDEPIMGSCTGSMSVGILADFTNTTPGLALSFCADIAGNPTDSEWQWEDGSVTRNQPVVMRVYAANGDYPVQLVAYNDDHVLGISTTITVHVSEQVTNYVDVSNATPSFPFRSWETAAASIQEAIDAVDQAGAMVLVKDGVYSTGEKVVYGPTPNRVAIDKPITVQSLNGPERTKILAPGSGRCVYAGNATTLSGFTLAQGSVPSFAGDEAEIQGGGIWCEETARVTNCIINGNFARIGGGVYGGTLDNCAIASNGAQYGGGAYRCIMSQCRLIENTADESGGGASASRLAHCEIFGNRALSHNGGGADWSSLYRCLLENNSANYDGGGCYNSDMTNCIVVGNCARAGGGSSGGQLAGCLVVSNSARYCGGGTSGGALRNCAIIGNSAYLAGGVHGGTLDNCIAYDNWASYAPNHTNATFNYSCTTPLPVGTGNIDSDPQMASVSHLAAGSPCVGAGHADYAVGTDLDGEVWRNPPAMGCDEVCPGGATGSLAVAAWTAYTNIPAGFPGRFQAGIVGRTTASKWEWGDGTATSNRPYAEHVYAVTGSYDVVLWAFNEEYSSGVAATVTVQVVESGEAMRDHYVAAASIRPLAPYLYWDTAAACIQDAVDAACVSGATVWVSNGVYAAGGRPFGGSLTNRVVIGNPIVVQSINGPDSTTIRGAPSVGDAAVRGVYMGSNAVLSGFRLESGATRMSGSASDQCGGGAWCESNAILTNCVLASNSSWSDGGGAWGGRFDNCIFDRNSAGNMGGGACSAMLNACELRNNQALIGAGASGGILNQCLVRNNSAGNISSKTGAGGGTAGSTLNNCTVVYNTAGYYGGGTYDGKANNCIIYYNTATYETDCMSVAEYSCMSVSVVGSCITAEPRFIDGFKLGPDSPCIDRGNNEHVQGETDLDGSPRVAYGTVDMGAYEAQFPVGYWVWASGITNGLTNYTDCAAGDGMPNLLRYSMGGSPMIPDDAASVGGRMSNGVPTLIFNRNSNAVDATFIVQIAESLTRGAVWRDLATNRMGSWGGASNVVDVDGGDARVCLVRDSGLLATSRYMRLKITRP